MGNLRILKGKNIIVWFEIPVRKISDVQEFYQNVFGMTITISNNGTREYGLISVPESGQQIDIGLFVEYLLPEPMPCSSIPYFAIPELLFNNIGPLIIINHGTFDLLTPSRPFPTLQYALCTDNKGNQFGLIPVSDSILDNEPTKESE